MTGKLSYEQTSCFYFLLMVTWKDNRFRCKAVVHTGVGLVIVRERLSQPEPDVGPSPSSREYRCGNVQPPPSTPGMFGARPGGVQMLKSHKRGGVTSNSKAAPCRWGGAVPHRWAPKGGAH